jgi:hypothetical protein
VQPLCLGQDITNERLAIWIGWGFPYQLKAEAEAFWAPVRMSEYWRLVEDGFDPFAADEADAA